MGHFDKLDEQHGLFIHLRDDNPAWWQLLKRQSDCYIDVRKDNTLNVYYNGGSLFKIDFPRGKPRLKTHLKYTGQAESGYVSYNEHEKLDQNALDNLKKRVKGFYGDKSESGIKARSVLATGSPYFDTEFAYTAPNSNGTHEILRIDMVRLNGNAIEFVELKRIRDNRLLDKSSYEAPTGNEEIVCQMKKYKKFLCENKAAIIEYYKRLLAIKSSLGLFPKVDTINLNLAEDVMLLIDMEDYEIKSPDARLRRRKALRRLLESNEIKYEIRSGTPL